MLQIPFSTINCALNTKNLRLTNLEKLVWKINFITCYIMLMKRSLSAMSIKMGISLTEWSLCGLHSSVNNIKSHYQYIDCKKLAHYPRTWKMSCKLGIQWFTECVAISVLQKAVWLCIFPYRPFGNGLNTQLLVDRQDGIFENQVAWEGSLHLQQYLFRLSDNVTYWIL
jgi:hypothetical protein